MGIICHGMEPMEPLRKMERNWDDMFWLGPTPLKNDGVSNSWDHEIPIYYGKLKKMFQTTNQFLLQVYNLDAQIL